MKCTALVLSLLSFSALAGPLPLRDHDWQLTDISEERLSRETLFKDLNRTLVRTHDSICSNRAHVWAHDFNKRYGLRTAKVFLFYTWQNANGWWYHAANVVNERGQMHVLDGGFPREVKKSQSLEEWLRYFSESSNCHEIRRGEADLIKLVRGGRAFPQRTSAGTFDCYYAIAPEGYWTPEQLARGLSGEEVHHELDEGEVFEACMEVTTSPLGWTWGSGAGRCNYFVTNGSRP